MAEAIFSRAEKAVSGRSKALVLAVVIGALLTVMGAPAAGRSDTADRLEDTRPLPSRWMSQDGLPRPRHVPPRYRGPFAVTKVTRRPPDLSAAASQLAPSKRVCLIVSDGVYDEIAAHLDVYQHDLETDGYEVVSYRLESGSAESVREFLRQLYEEPESLVGAVLIGDVPYVIYEMMQRFSPQEPVWYEDFPCDLYFMDLDGVWGDVLEDVSVHAGNGKYDTHTGDVGLEVWVSRLTAGNLPELGTEPELLRNYFQKNHAYSTDGMPVETRALMYLDDGWADMSAADEAAAAAVYGSDATEAVDDPEMTTRDDYLSRIAYQGHELVHTRSHGYAQAHTYVRANGRIHEWVWAADYALYDPRALFYSFFVCGAADYTMEGHLAGTAVFNRSWGLFAWGSTKTGGLWQDWAFYESLAAGHCFGDAFLTWYSDVQGRQPSLAPLWWYGMALTGDATLSRRLFRDVGRAHWAQREIAACVGADIVSGYQDDTYQPALSVSRDQMAVYIARALAGGDEHVPPGPSEPSFADVAVEDWAYRYIEYAVANDIVRGYADQHYHPDLTVDRGQMAVFVARSIATPVGEAGLADYVPPDPPTFEDVTGGNEWSWCHKHVEYLAEAGVIGGYPDGRYHPHCSCSRDQMAVYIARAFQLQ